MCRHYRQSKYKVSSSRHVCTGESSACRAGSDKHALHLTSSNCLMQSCSRRSADCHATTPVGGPACQPRGRAGGLRWLPPGSSVSDATPVPPSSKRRINDVMSQCIQAYCTDVLNHVRIACILNHCNRSRRGGRIDWHVPTSLVPRRHLVLPKTRVQQYVFICCINMDYVSLFSSLTAQWSFKNSGEMVQGLLKRLSLILQETQLSLTNRATRLEANHDHQTWYRSIC